MDEVMNGGTPPEEAELYAEIQKERGYNSDESKVINIVKRDVL